MDQPTGKISAPGKSSQPKKRRRRGRGLFNLILFLGIIAAIALFAWAEQQRRAAISELEQTEQELEEIRQSTQRRGSEVAQEVLDTVRTLIDIPTEPEPTVATIVDVEALREANEFYNKAENGDHLIITETRAVLYDPDRKIILDVVPVQINQEQQQQIPEGEPGAEGGQIEATPSPAQPDGEDQDSASPEGQAPGEIQQPGTGTEQPTTP